MKRRTITQKKNYRQDKQRRPAVPKNFRRFKAYIEYDGTRYSGWQVQPNARTIQGELLKAGAIIFQNSVIDIQGSGRTDAGVHAICQIAHIDADTMLAPEIMKMKFNDLLPHDINILEIEKSTTQFHARHSAEERTYLYQISERRTAFGKNYVWWIKDRLNFEKMKEAAEHFRGMHDFSSFSDEDPDEKSTKVLISNISLKKTEDMILFRVTGSHFLWKMVRRMVGILAEVGRGKMEAGTIKKLLTEKSNLPAKYTAPPSGLYLEKIYYEKLVTETPPEPFFFVRSFQSGSQK